LQWGIEFSIMCLSKNQEPQWNPNRLKKVPQRQKPA